MRKYTPTNVTVPSDPGPAYSMGHRRSRARTWWQRWTPSGSTGRCSFRHGRCYRFDATYAVEVHSAHPGRFGLIKPVDPRRSDVGEVVEEWAGAPGAVGARIMLVHDTTLNHDEPGIDAVLAAGARTGLPINILCWGVVPLVGELAARHPDTRIVVDHLGLLQPFEPPAPAEPWADLPLVLDLANHDNVAVKVTGACTLAHEPFPYADIWEPLGRLFDAFGFDRLLWGTDWTRAVELPHLRARCRVVPHHRSTVRR